MIPKLGYEELCLEAFHAYASKVIADRALELGDARIFTQNTLEGLILTLHTYLYGEKLESEKVEYPIDWWEAVKERFAPAWALKRWPVKKRVYWLEAWQLYPQFKAPKNLGGTLRIPIFKQENNWLKPEDLE